MSTALNTGAPLRGSLDDPARTTLLLAVLCASSAAETTAEGSARRAAYRVTRHLLGGANRLGLAADQIAAALGVRTDTVRTRSTEDGLVTAKEFAARAPITESTIATWQAHGWVNLDGPDTGGNIGYRASHLLDALLSHKDVEA
ncbi:hypothetical protein [Leifsonia sp. Le1]|uniref:hypothetical protein n=1 Tax=Leifsonia sp. Le1 TaxID=3404918 RepID=UPI003EBCEBC8